MPEAENRPDPAAKRFWLLQAVRLSGMAMVVFGAMILAGTLAAPAALGVVLLVGGMLEFFFLPAILARKWKSPGNR